MTIHLFQKEIEGFLKNSIKFICSFSSYTRKQFLIVGTKNKVMDSITRVIIKDRCHYVNKKIGSVV